MGSRRKYTITDGSEWLSVKEVAAVLGYGSAGTFYMAVRRGRHGDLVGHKMSPTKTSPWLFHRDDVEDHLNRSAVPVGVAFAQSSAEDCEDGQ